MSERNCGNCKHKPITDTICPRSISIGTEEDPYKCWEPRESGTSIVYRTRNSIGSSFLDRINNNKPEWFYRQEYECSPINESDCWDALIDHERMKRVQGYEERFGGPIYPTAEERARIEELLRNVRSNEGVVIEPEPEPETHTCEDKPDDHSITKYGNSWTLCKSNDWGLGVNIKYCPFCQYELGTIRSDTIKDEDRETIQKGEFEIIL